MVMEKKLIKDLAVNECIHAPTKEISDSLCKKFDELGLKWSDGSSYIENNYNSTYGDQTHYIPFNGTYCGLGYAESHCNVYTISDLLDFDDDLVLSSDEGYTKEEIELLDKFAGVSLSACLSEVSLGDGISKEDVDIMCNGCYLMAKSMLRARKEALKNG